MSLRFLSVNDVLAIHRNTIEIEGGSPGLRDAGLLESAVMMPQQQFDGEYLHPDLVSMASVYLFHIVSNHPFLDGNKRTGVLAALVFLQVNGVEELPVPEELERLTMQIAAGELAKADLTDWLRSQVT